MSETRGAATPTDIELDTTPALIHVPARVAARAREGTTVEPHPRLREQHRAA